jgi:F-type H+-transporting ATPase subunit gamma
MASLQELRQRQRSVKSTRKITQAMKMIAAAKLRKAQERAESGRPYANLMAELVDDLIVRASKFNLSAPDLLIGNDNDNIRMFVIVTSNRGLCGGFNGSVVRKARQLAKEHKNNGGEFKFFCIGRKGYDQLRFEFSNFIVDKVSLMDKPSYSYASSISDNLISLFRDNTFDRCVLVYNKFVSAMTQEVRAHKLIPFKPFIDEESAGLMDVSVSDNTTDISKSSGNSDSFYEYEPGEDYILEHLLPTNISVQIYRSLLESSAGEQGARMTAMDSATRNAGDMIKKLQLEYNRTRQAQITKELIEIISGAEAV